jgi:Ni/Co efflux regulator RcnB
MLESVDDEGRDLTAFCQHCLEIGLRRGLVHILVDYPAVTVTSLAEERELDLHPLLLAIDPKDLIGWRYEQRQNSSKVLTQIRIAETVNVDKGDYGVEQRRRVRIINENDWQLYELPSGTEGEDWVLIDEGPWTVGKITLVTVYLHKTGFMTAKCPLEGLAWLNLAHYQSMTDHRNNLRFARAGVIFRKGMSKEELQKPVVVGVNQEFGCTSPNADMKIIEHSGAAIAASETELQHLEDQMDVMARGPLLVKSSSRTTATGEAIEEGKGQCELQSWVHRLEPAIVQAVRLAGEWRNEPVPDDWAVEIYDDFGILLRADEDLLFLQNARNGGDLDRRTYLEGLKLRGVLPENADIDAIMEAIKEEGPDLGMIGRPAEITPPGTFRGEVPKPEIATVPEGGQLNERPGSGTGGGAR